jgi:hypothetical protein
LLGDTPRALALLDAIEAKQIDPAAISKAQLTKLKEHTDATVKNRAAKLLGSSNP